MSSHLIYLCPTRLRQNVFRRTFACEFIVLVTSAMLPTALRRPASNVVIRGARGVLVTRWRNPRTRGRRSSPQREPQVTRSVGVIICMGLQSPAREADRIWSTKKFVNVYIANAIAARRTLLERRSAPTANINAARNAPDSRMSFCFFPLDLMPSDTCFVM